MSERLAPKKPRDECAVDGCSKPSSVRGYCSKHYARLMRNGSPTAGRTEDGVFLAWLTAHVRHDEDDCLYYPPREASAGAIMIKVAKKQYRASRYICMLAHGDPPTPKHEAAHSCGHGHLGCLNQNHLRWATKQENEDDKKIHGTLPTGKRRSHLSESEVVAIRNSGDTAAKLAPRFGVSVSTINQVRSLATWASVG